MTAQRSPSPRPPITLEYALRCSPEHAFAVYTGRIGEWWDARYTANAETLEAVTIERRVCGRVFATHSDVGEHDWGEVTVWELGRRLAHTFTLAQGARYPSEVAVDFVPGEGGGCVVHFAHGGWTKANAGERKKVGDWPVSAQGANRVERALLRPRSETRESVDPFSRRSSLHILRADTRTSEAQLARIDISPRRGQERISVIV